MAMRSQNAGVGGPTSLKEMAAELEKQTPTPWDLDLWEDGLQPYECCCWTCGLYVYFGLPVFCLPSNLLFSLGFVF